MHGESGFVWVYFNYQYDTPHQQIQCTIIISGNVTPSFFHYQHIATAQGLKSKPFLQVSILDSLGLDNLKNTIASDNQTLQY